MSKRIPTVSIVRHVSVYQPAVPLRAVSVHLTDSGEVETIEHPVVGIQVVVRDNWYHRPVPADAASDPVINGLSEAALVEAGYRPERDHTTDHHVVVWDEQYSSALPLDGSLLEHGDYIVGPASNPDAWWKSRIDAQAKKLRVN